MPTTNWPTVKSILDGILGDWKARNHRDPNFGDPSTHGNANFGWATKQQLLDSTPQGLKLITLAANGKPVDDAGNPITGKDTNLVVALREGVPGFPQMPDNGPFLTDPDPKYKGQLDYIIRWIDEGLPD